MGVMDAVIREIKYVATGILFFAVVFGTVASGWWLTENAPWVFYIAGIILVLGLFRWVGKDMLGE